MFAHLEFRDLFKMSFHSRKFPSIVTNHASPNRRGDEGGSNTTLLFKQQRECLFLAFSLEPESLFWAQWTLFADRSLAFDQPSSPLKFLKDLQDQLVILFERSKMAPIK